MFYAIKKSWTHIYLCMHSDSYSFLNEVLFCMCHYKTGRNEDGNFFEEGKTVFREFAYRACNVYFCKGWGVFIILKCKNTKERNCKLFLVMYTYHFHLLVHSLCFEIQINMSHQTSNWGCEIISYRKIILNLEKYSIENKE